MNRSGRSARSSQRGQVLVIVAAGAVTMLLLVGLVLDGGIAMFNRRDAQNTADLAAMAGTKVVQDHYKVASTESIYTAVNSTVMANGCTTTGTVPCSWEAWYVGAGPVDLAPITAASTMPLGTIGVRVHIERQPSTFVIGMAGINHWDVDTQATAVTGRPAAAPAGQLLPIAMKQDPAGYQAGQVYDLTEGKDAPGGFGYISWTGSNDAGALATSLCTPDNPSFYLPIDFPADPGKTNASDVRACNTGWIDTAQTILIPIYDTVTGTGNGAVYHIVGIAAFVVTSQGQPAIDNIRGYFVETFPYTDPVPGGVGTLPPTAGDTSVMMGLIH